VNGDLGWTDLCIGDVVQRLNDRRETPESDGISRYVGVEHLDSDDLELRRWGRSDDGSLPPTFRFVFPAGAVLFPTRRPALRKCAIAPFEGITGEKILVLTTRDAAKLAPAFLPYLLSSPAIRQWVINRAIGSVTPHFRWRDLAERKILLPSLRRQEELASALACAREYVETTSTCLNSIFRVRLSAQRDLLLRDGAVEGRCELPGSF
jgi:type I restriction enzyme, S subunit